MNPSDMRRLMNTIDQVTAAANPALGDGDFDEIVVVYDKLGERYLLTEGKWIQTTSGGRIRVDHPTHGVGQTHAHVYGRKGNEIGVVKIDGAGSHGSKMKLSKADADALRMQGFAIRSDRVVEWTLHANLSWSVLLG